MLIHCRQLGTQNYKPTTTDNQDLLIFSKILNENLHFSLICTIHSARCPHELHLQITTLALHFSYIIVTPFTSCITKNKGVISGCMWIHPLIAIMAWFLQMIILYFNEDTVGNIFCMTTQNYLLASADKWDKTGNRWIRSVLENWDEFSDQGSHTFLPINFK